MENIILKAYAKLNLSLNLLPEKDEKGYYDVLFVNSQLSLSDRLKIQKIGDKTIKINDPAGMDEASLKTHSNIAYRAAQLMCRRFHITEGFSIHISKQIPIRAGLGGGSSDAAATINGISALFHLPAKDDEKLLVAKQLGMDVCYCVIGGLAMVQGKGEMVKRLPFRLSSLNILVATPPMTKPSTAWAYSIVDNESIGKNRDKVESLLEGIRKNDVGMIASNMHNDFELPIQRHYPITGEMKTIMMRNGAAGALLAGSGLSVFGIFEDVKRSLQAKAELEKRGIRCSVARSIDKI